MRSLWMTATVKHS